MLRDFVACRERFHHVERMLLLISQQKWKQRDWTHLGFINLISISCLGCISIIVGYCRIFFTEKIRTEINFRHSRVLNIHAYMQVNMFKCRKSFLRLVYIFETISNLYLVIRLKSRSQKTVLRRLGFELKDFWRVLLFYVN